MTLREKLKSEMLSGCPKCGGSGVVDFEDCSCFLRFKAYNRLCGHNEQDVHYGFSRNLLDIVSEEDSDVYIFDTFPDIENKEQLENLIEYVDKPEKVLDYGLSLYLYSQEYGRGKTTLAHFLAYVFAEWSFFDLSNYQKLFSRSPDRDNLFFLRNAQKILENPEEYMRVPFLVIDDMGNENRSASWKRETAIAAYQMLFHCREDNRLPTIITSNYTPEHINRLYERHLESLLGLSPDGGMYGRWRAIELCGGEDLRQLYQTGWN